MKLAQCEKQETKYEIVHKSWKRITQYIKKEYHISEEIHIQTTNLTSGLNINANVYKDITTSD